MRCDYFRENIDALLDNELSPAIAEEMWRHKNECAECRALMEEAESLRDELRNLGNRLPPVDFTQTMMKAVREEARKDKRGGSRGGRKLTWKGVTGIVAAAAVLIVCIPLLGGALFSGAMYGGTAMYRGAAMNESAVMPEVYMSAPQASSAPAVVYDRDMAEEEKQGLLRGENSASAGGSNVMDMGAPTGGWGDETGVIAPSPTPTEPDAGNNEHGLKIIRNGDMSLETNQFDRDFQAISDAIAHYEGYTESMSSSGNSAYAEAQYQSNRWGSITARIPAQALDAFMREVGSIGNVTNQSTYSEDVTARYHDTELQLTTLRTQHERLLELVRQATEVSDLIALEQELQSVQYKIDSLTGSLRSWDARVDYSTINIYVSEVRSFTSTETDSLPDRMMKALTNSIEGVKELGRNIAIGATAALPYIAIVLIFAAVVLVIVLVARAARRKK